MKNQTIKKILESAEGRDIIDFIKGKIQSTNRLDDIPSNWTDKKIAIEMKARKLAAEKLAEILSPLLEFQELPEKEEEEYY